eukprot:TRINITY_DN31780_c0_g1_i1.p2 TRINITY_DN31780_c0_g1~~TRINITY_DN31780_c0_g1_i1.p2  ORF type:complete len:113 (+),score=23.16 TRINITY_DN31780_c0_g1_i1:160-498(+)
MAGVAAREHTLDLDPPGPSWLGSMPVMDRDAAMVHVECQIRHLATYPKRKHTSPQFSECSGRAANVAANAHSRKRLQQRLSCYRPPIAQVRTGLRDKYDDCLLYTSPSPRDS